MYALASGNTFRDDEGGNWLLSFLFRKALQSDVLFESLILFVLSQAPAGLAISTEREDEQAFLSLRGRMIRKLQRRLGVPRECIDDITIHTILNLMASDVSEHSQPAPIISA